MRTMPYPIKNTAGTWCVQRKIATLRDAAIYITKLPKGEHMAPEWQAAMEALILVATLGGPTMSRASASYER
jgi:hypothetical protein